MHNQGLWPPSPPYPPYPPYGQPQEKQGRSRGKKIAAIVALVVFGPGIVCQLFTWLGQASQSIVRAVAPTQPSTPVLILFIIVVPALLTIGMVGGIAWLVVRALFGKGA